MVLELIINYCTIQISLVMRLFCLTKFNCNSDFTLLFGKLYLLLGKQ